MASTDSFKPGAGGLQVSVIGGQGNRELGKNFALGAAPAPPALSQTPVPSQQQAQIGQSNGPKGAQPVSLMGLAPQGQPILGQQAIGQQQMGQQVPKMPMAPGMHQLGKSQGPSMDGEVHTIVVEGVAPDGKTYLAEYDAVFPKGTKVMGVTEKISG